MKHNRRSNGGLERSYLTVEAVARKIHVSERQDNVFSVDETAMELWVQVAELNDAVSLASIPFLSPIQIRCLLAVMLMLLTVCVYVITNHVMCMFYDNEN